MTPLPLTVSDQRLHRQLLTGQSSLRLQPKTPYDSGISPLSVLRRPSPTRGALQGASLFSSKSEFIVDIEESAVAEKRKKDAEVSKRFREREKRRNRHRARLGSKTAGGTRTLPDLLSDVVGPCINIIPIRADTGAHATIQDMAAFIHNPMLASMRFELNQISDTKASMDWSPSMGFGFVVQFQNIDEHPGFIFTVERIELRSLDFVPHTIPTKD